MDSVERLVRGNAFELSGMFGFEAGNTVYNRLNRIASGDGLVGYALDALKEAFFGEQASRLILVEYEALTKVPGQTMELLYKLLDEPAFAHDFDNVEYAAEDFDMGIGTPGLHTVRRKVEWVERQSVLPPELFRRFVNDAFWRYPGANIRDVPIIRYEAPADAEAGLTPAGQGER